MHVECSKHMNNSKEVQQFPKKVTGYTTAFSDLNNKQGAGSTGGLKFSAAQTLGSISDKQWKVLQICRDSDRPWDMLNEILKLVHLSHWGIMSVWIPNKDEVARVVLDNLRFLPPEYTFGLGIENQLYDYIQYTPGYLTFLKQSNILNPFVEDTQTNFGKGNEQKVGDEGSDGITNDPSVIRSIIFYGLENGVFKDVMDGLRAIRDRRVEARIQSRICPFFDKNCLSCKNGRINTLLGVYFTNTD